MGCRRARLPFVARLPVILLLLGLAPGGSVLPQPGPPPAFEYEVKASFIYTVARFVDWPADAFADPGAPLVFAVLGDDPIEATLLRTTTGKTVGGHPVEVIRLTDVPGLRPCHVLVVGRTESGRVEEVIRSLGSSSVLTVGEFERFAQRGGVLRLRLEENMIRFEVNVDAAARARLKVSSKILKIGKIVRDHKGSAGAP